MTKFKFGKYSFIKTLKKEVENFTSTLKFLKPYTPDMLNNLLQLIEAEEVIEGGQIVDKPVAIDAYGGVVFPTNSILISTSLKFNHNDCTMSDDYLSPAFYYKGKNLSKLILKNVFSKNDIKVNITYIKEKVDNQTVTKIIMNLKYPVMKILKDAFNDNLSENDATDNLDKLIIDYAADVEIIGGNEEFVFPIVDNLNYG